MIRKKGHIGNDVIIIIAMTGLFKKTPEQIERKKALVKKKQLKKLVKEKKYDKVLQVGAQVLDKIPHDNDVLFILGGVYYMQNKHKSAISYFDKALEISTYDPEILLLKANSLFKLGRPDESAQCCKKIKEIDPNNKQVIELLAKIDAIK